MQPTKREKLADIGAAVLVAMALTMLALEWFDVLVK